MRLYKDVCKNFQHEQKKDYCFNTEIIGEVGTENLVIVIHKEESIVVIFTNYAKVIDLF